MKHADRTKEGNNDRKEERQTEGRTDSKHEHKKERMTKDTEKGVTNKSCKEDISEGI